MDSFDPGKDGGSGKINSSPTTAEYDEIRRSIHVYLLVGLVLFSGTLATAAVATIPALDVGAHGFDKWDAMLGIMIATIKASLVAAVFMHLKHERRLVYVVISIGVLNAAGFFMGTYLHLTEITHDDYFYHPEGVEQPVMNPSDVAKVSEP
ncbi:MAG: cytochrome C oxidase subunit IV family protein [Luteolibacter sp.]